MEDLDVTQYDLPDVPGVYIFKHGRQVLYIGKATSLRDRVRSYFSRNLRISRSELIERMIEEASDIDWQITESVLEALILEANLIKTHQPPYNTKAKDNKSFSYVVLTNEVFPRVVIVRGRELQKIEAERDQGENFSRISTRSTSAGNLVRKYGVKKMFGPFTSLQQLREALKIIRTLFPFRDAKCLLPSKQTMKKVVEAKPCFNYQLGLCPGTCVDAISKQEYARSIRNISLFFEGRKKQLVRSLEKDMKQHADAERFEAAAKVRNTLWSLEHINDMSMLKRERVSTEGDTFRIEAYDVAHFGGSDEVGVMTVAEKGQPKQEEYRTFNIKGGYGGGDTGALKEILSRRLTHPEWEAPSLVVVDGGTAQINVARTVLEDAGLPIPVVGVVKDEKHRPRDIKGDHDLIKKHEDAILKANAEAHRFAIGFHRKRRRIPYR